VLVVVFDRQAAEVVVARLARPSVAAHLERPKLQEHLDRAIATLVVRNSAAHTVVAADHLVADSA